MIPQKLTIQGVFSYRDKQEIDFARLAASHLFGIFGPVGSGKSAILEAITYALYGRLERLNERDKTAYNMMNLKSNTMLIDFEFVGADGVVYRFVVEGKRNRKRFDTIRSLERRAFKKVNAEWVPLESALVDSIIGLSYDNFRRTIIIPQGKFQEFLQLGNKDRTVMLKELFGLNKFDLSWKASALRDTNARAINTVNGRLEGLEGIRAEAIDAKKKELDGLAAERAAARKTKTELESVKRESDTVKELFSRFESALSALKEFTADEPQWDEREARCNELDLCRRTFHGPVAQLTEARKRYAQSAKDLVEDSRKLELGRDRLAACQQAHALAKREFERLDTLGQKARDLRGIADLLDLTDTLEKRNGELARLEKTAAATAEQFQNQSRLEQDLQERSRTLRANQPDRELLAAVHAWFVRLDELGKLVRDTELERERTAGEVAHAKGELDSAGIVTDVDLGGVALTECSVKERLDATERYIAQLERGLDLNRGKLEQVARREGLALYATDLADGTPCPLCGSLEHPHLGGFAHLDTEREALLVESEQFRNRIADARESLKKISAAGQKLSIAHKALELADARCSQARQSVDHHQKAFVWTEYGQSDRERVCEELGACRAAEMQLRALDQDLAAVQSSLVSVKNKAEQTANDVQECRKGIAALDGAAGVMGSGLVVLRLEDYCGARPDTVRKEAQAAEELAVQIRDSFVRAGTALEKATRDTDTLSGVVATEEKDVARNESLCADFSATIDRLLKDSPFDTFAKVEGILAEETDLAAERKTIEAFRRELHAARKQVEDLQAQTEGRVFDESAYRQVCRDLETVQVTLDTLNHRCGALEQQITRDSELLAEKVELTAKKRALESRGETITTLLNLFKGSAFVNYVSTVYLQQLCESANTRFSALTRQRLRLELEEDNSFRVRDFLNGGNVRSVKTLSGGQTFQASLSLALALVEQARLFTKSLQNFFFLDEGFGSQDPESLRHVFDTLKSLRHENRVVGVISHVDELKQEIDTFLTVSNSGEDGSVVKAGWE